jgi:selenocysteine-specific translation elongation factor
MKGSIKYAIVYPPLFVEDYHKYNLLISSLIEEINGISIAALIVHQIDPVSK